ncbi:hypothetical protein TNCV_4956381 [Trichonephila clavipes]|nr:hypothetical protein TNCV_4956381 [Trichonephila clavipes]
MDETNIRRCCKPNDITVTCKYSMVFNNSLTVYYLLYILLKKGCVTNALDSKEDDTVCENGDANSEVSYDNGRVESFSKHDTYARSTLIRITNEKETRFRCEDWRPLNARSRSDDVLFVLSNFLKACNGCNLFDCPSATFSNKCVYGIDY